MPTELCDLKGRIPSVMNKHSPDTKNSPASRNYGKQLPVPVGIAKKYRFVFTEARGKRKQHRDTNGKRRQC